MTARPYNELTADWPWWRKLRVKLHARRLRASIALCEEAMRFAGVYAARSGTTVDVLRKHGRNPYRCFCGEDGCEGWAMLSHDAAADEITRGRAEDVCGWLT